jgi:HSP20 family molecular chaperone IbpA
MRQFRLRDNVNVDGISTKLENDVLTVNAPKIKPEAVSIGDVKSIYIYASDKY